VYSSVGLQDGKSYASLSLEPYPQSKESRDYNSLRSLFRLHASMRIGSLPPPKKILSTAGLIRLRKDNACNHFERLLSEARHAFKSLKIGANKNHPACFAYADGKIKGSGDVDKKHN
jgi:hypothetical protein